MWQERNERNILSLCRVAGVLYLCKGRTVTASRPAAS